MEPHVFFIQLMVILLSARICGEVVARFKIPAVIGEMAAGILLGPSLLGWVEPHSIIKLLAEIGIILLLFEVGLQTDLGRLVQTGYRPFIVAVTGVVAPFVLGFIVSFFLFRLSVLTSLFIGGTLTATSIGITVRVLSDLKKQNTDEAQIVLGAAVLDDIIGVIILALLYQYSEGGGISIVNTGKVVVFIAIFLVLAPIAAKLISAAIKHFDSVSEIPGLIPTSIVSLLLFFAWIAHAVGSPQLLGGFAAGLALTRKFFLPFAAYLNTDHAFAKRMEEQMRPIVHLFTPIFFVMVGLSLNLKAVDWSSPLIWGLSLAILAAAVAGKLVSGYVLFRDKPAIRKAVGLAMIPRGEVGLIFAELGRSSGIFDNSIYAAMIIVIALTTMVTPFIMRSFYIRQDRLAAAGAVSAGL
jgi:Kef-type K+ transport system membrane component KefB